METRFGESQNATASILSPQSEAVANDLQELTLQPSHNALPITERKNVLQLKLQQRRTREELVNQGIMPPLKSSAVFHEQRRSLERARTEDYLKRKIKTRPERSELIRMHILRETSTEPSLQAKQLQLKRARLADDLNDKISHRPGPMELIHKNILPIHSSIKQAIIETQFPETSGENSSCDEDSNDSLSPEQPVSQDSSPALGHLPSPANTLPGNSGPSPTQVPLSAPPLPVVSGSSTSPKLTNGTASISVQRTSVSSQIKSQPKPNADRSAQRHKKPKDNKPKIKKLKYHQYIPPDQKGDKEPPPHLDSSYAKILQQQQLFLQLQILSQQQQQQQQQHYNYHAILPAPPKSETDQQPSLSSNSKASFSPPWPVAAPSSQQSSAPSDGTKPVSLPPNLDELKVAELKSELKLRSLPVSGTKNDLIERLRAYQELNGGSDTTTSTTAGGTTGLGAEGTGKALKTTATTTGNGISQQQFQSHLPSTLVTQTAGVGNSIASSTATPQQLINYNGEVSPQSMSLPHLDHSPPTISLEDTKYKSDGCGEMPSSSSSAQLMVNIKEELPSATLAPVSCQLSLKPVCLQRHCPQSSTSPKPKTTSPVVTMDKDKMLKEKDKQIEELTRMLRQKQRLVEVLRMQLEHSNKGQVQGQVSETVVLLRVKEEPPDKPSVTGSSGHQPFLPGTSPLLDAAKVTVKQEVVGSEGIMPETKIPDILGSQRSDSQLQKSQEQIQLQTKSEQTNTSRDQQVRQQQVTLQLQQQALQRLLLQEQQQKIQNCSQKLENQQNLQKMSQQRKKKSQKQQQQQTHVKQQILLKQQKVFIQQQQTPKETKPPQQVQIQTKIQLKHQHLQKQQAVSAQLSRQSGSTPSSLPLDLLKSNSTPTLITDSDGNHFLISLTSLVTENQTPDEPESKTTNHITLQRLQSTPVKLPSRNTIQLHEGDNETKQIIHTGSLKQHIAKAHNRGLQLCVDQPQPEVTQSLLAHPTLQPLFKDQVTTGKNPASSPPQTICPGLDYLFSPLSPADSSHDTKDTEHEEDFIDIILQRGEISSFKPAPDPFLEHLHSTASSPPPSPLKPLLSHPVPSSCHTPQSATAQCHVAEATEEMPWLSSNGRTGRLEDFLESTTGKPLLGVEPGGMLTLIDDLHSQMLCTPSILDHPPSPMDTLDMASEPTGGVGEDGVDSMDWLDLTMGEKTTEDPPTLALLGPQTPQSVFSSDFLDSYDLQYIHWDSCL